MLLLGWAGLAVLAGLGWRLLANWQMRALRKIDADIAANRDRATAIERRLALGADRSQARKEANAARADRALDLRAVRITVHARVITLAEVQDQRVVAAASVAKMTEEKRAEPMPPQAMALVTRESEPWAQDQVAAFLRERYKVLGDWDLAVAEARRLQVEPPAPAWIG